MLQDIEDYEMGRIISASLRTAIPIFFPLAATISQMKQEPLVKGTKNILIMKVLNLAMEDVRIDELSYNYVQLYCAI